MVCTVIIGSGPASVGAFVPDLSGCVAVAESEAEVRTLIAEAVAFHIERLAEAGEPVPPPRAIAGTVTGPAAAA